MKKHKIFTVLSIVRSSIHRIDPFGLLAGGAPDDEFDSEISSIASQLERCNSSKDISHIIAKVLNSSFSENFQPNSFEAEANKIYDALKENGIK